MTRLRVALSERQIQVLVGAAREALAGGLMRGGEVADLQDVVELLDRTLPSAPDRHPAGRTAGRFLLREAILRLLAGAEDEGRSSLSLWEVDAGLIGKPAGTSIQRVVDELAREKLIRVHAGDRRLLSLTSAGRARGRRSMTPALDEHRVQEPEQLLDLIYRARSGGLSRWLDDGGEISVDAIWHVPTVQGVAGVGPERFAALLAALGADALIGPGMGSYRTITRAGSSLAARRFAEHRLPSGPLEPARLLPPTRRPRELIRRREDSGCPLCGRPASWLRTRKGRRYEELRTVGVAEHACGDCSVTWTVYAEPVDEHGGYDPFADPVVCRPRWAFRSGYWSGARLAPPDHWEGR